MGFPHMRLRPCFETGGLVVWCPPPLVAWAPNQPHQLTALRAVAERRSRQSGLRMDEISAAELPDPLPPRLWCDFNSFGLGGEPVYFTLDRETLNALPARIGLEVFLWDESDETEVVGCVAKLEWVKAGWCARPVGGMYIGAPPW